MKTTAVLLAGVLIGILVIVGCTGGPTPTLPSDNRGSEQGLTAQAAQTAPSEANLWGYFDLYLDPESKAIEATPNRSVGFASNVVKFLNKDPIALSVKSNGVTPGPGYVDVDIDITIKHPLSQSEYDGYDVRGIFIGNGSSQLKYSSDLYYPAAGTDQILLNADGYSRWWNPGEFPVPKIFGYVPGKAAPPGYAGTATLNPYKYFGEGLKTSGDLWSYLTSGEPNVGYYLAGTWNTRNYKLRFPVPLPGIKYGYAVVADWKGIAPQDHPAHAPEAVGLKVTDNSNLYYVDDSYKGGNLILDIAVFDWDAVLTSGVMEDYHISVESTVQTAAHQLDPSEMTPIGGGDQWSTYHVEIPGDNITGTENNEMWIVVEDSLADYTNPIGVPNDADGDKIAACFRYPVKVASKEPTWIDVTVPNGGEQWLAGWSNDITWEAHPLIQNVKIELSLNSGADYTQVITDSTPNDGTFTWDPIPSEAVGATDRIRISDVDDATVFDESDADFTVVQPSFNMVVPNGGESWQGGTDHMMIWTSQYIDSKVNLWYSTDDFVSDIQSIATSIDNTGNFQWQNIPKLDSTTLKVRVSTDSGPLFQDESDDYFQIYTPVIQVTGPNGGEKWLVGSAHDITWTSQNLFGTVDIWYSKDNFVSDINVIVQWTDNDGSYTWFNIPNDLSNTVRVKVSYSPDPNVYDVSDNDFTIGTNGWVQTLNDQGSSANGVVTDANGNAYVTGRLGSGEAFLRRYSSGTGQMSWQRLWGSGGVAWGNSIVTDGQGNFYVVGGFSGTDIDFNPGSGTDLHSSNGGDDIFISKFSVGGPGPAHFEWARTWGSSGLTDEEDAYGVAVGTTDVYVTGYFQDYVDFDPGAGEDFHSSVGITDAYLSRFDASGNFVWAGTWGGTGVTYGDGVRVDASDRAFVAGTFSGTTDFDPDAVDEYSKTSNGDYDSFFTWFDSSNDFQGTYAWGGPGYDEANWIATDALGDMYVTGDFSDADVNLDPTGGTDLHSSAGLDDVFLTKFDSSLAFQWARTWGGTDDDFSISVAADALGNAFVAGGFQSLDADFDPGAGTDLHSSNGDNDAFWSMIDASGNFVMARTFGGLNSDMIGDINVSGSGAIYVAGWFASTDVEFAPTGAPCFSDSAIYSVPVDGDNDGFVIKYLSDGCL